MTAAGRKYLREVKKRVLSHGDERRKYLNAMENRTIEYVRENPDATVEELSENLGDLAAIGQQQIEECPQKKLLFLARGGRIALNGLWITIAAVVLALALAITIIVIDNNKDANGYTRDEIGTIE